MMFPTKFYVAASSQIAALELKTKLEAQGHKITARWITHDSKFGQGQRAYGPGERRELAVMDIEDVKAAEALVLVSEPDGKRVAGGKHVETGVALAIGIPVYVIGTPENLFHEHPLVQVLPDMQEFLAMTDTKRPGRTEADLAEAVAKHVAQSVETVAEIPPESRTIVGATELDEQDEQEPDPAEDPPEDCDEEQDAEFQEKIQDWYHRNRQEVTTASNANWDIMANSVIWLGTLMTLGGIIYGSKLPGLTNWVLRGMTTALVAWAGFAVVLMLVSLILWDKAIDCRRISLEQGLERSSDYDAMCATTARWNTRATWCHYVSMWCFIFAVAWMVLLGVLTILF